MVRPVDQIGQAIEALQQCRLATPCWAENGKDFIGPDLEMNISKNLHRVVIEIECFNDDLVWLNRFHHFRSDDEYTG